MAIPKGFTGGWATITDPATNDQKLVQIDAQGNVTNSDEESFRGQNISSIPNASIDAGWSGDSPVDPAGASPLYEASMPDSGGQGWVDQNTGQRLTAPSNFANLKGGADYNFTNWLNLGDAKQQYAKAMDPNAFPDVAGSLTQYNSSHPVDQPNAFFDTYGPALMKMAGTYAAGAGFMGAAGDIAGSSASGLGYSMPDMSPDSLPLDTPLPYDAGEPVNGSPITEDSAPLSNSETLTTGADSGAPLSNPNVTAPSGDMGYQIPDTSAPDGINGGLTQNEVVANDAASGIDTTTTTHPSFLDPLTDALSRSWHNNALGTVAGGASILGSVAQLIKNSSAASAAKDAASQAAAANATRQAFLDNPNGYPAGGPQFGSRTALNPAVTTNYGKSASPGEATFFANNSLPVSRPHAARGGAFDHLLHAAHAHGHDAMYHSPLQEGSDLGHAENEMMSPLVQGAGGGQDDKVPAQLSPSEYVMDADTVAALGDGNPEEGARKLDAFRHNLRAHKRGAPPSKIPPKARPIEHYFGRAA